METSGSWTQNHKCAEKVMNYIKRFKIKSEESKYWIWVLLYDNIDLLRVDAKKEDGEPFLDTLGVSHHYERIIYEDGVEIGILDNIGKIRLCTDYLGATVVAHEVLHSALWIYRLENNKTCDLGSECNDKEEKLCHIYGQLYACFLKKMYDLKFY